MEKVYEIFIKTTPERLWEAIIDPEIRAKYNFGAAVYSEWKVGAPISVDVERHGVHLGEGEVLEVDPPRRLVHTMAALWDDDVKAEGVSRVTWEIETVGDDSCHLTLTHDQMREGANSQIYGGWPMILSGLKTWLETGEELTTPGSIRYSCDAAADRDRVRDARRCHAGARITRRGSGRRVRARWVGRGLRRRGPADGCGRGHAEHQRVPVRAQDLREDAGLLAPAARRQPDGGAPERHAEVRRHRGRWTTRT